MMPSEIIEAIERKTGPEAWLDLFEDFVWGDADKLERDAVLRQCARFLHQEFPGRTWGWQDFDKLITQALNDRYPSIAATGERWALDAVCDNDLTDAEFDAIRAEGPEGFTQYAVKGEARWIEVDDPYGGVLVFIGINSIDDVRR